MDAYSRRSTATRGARPWEHSPGGSKPMGWPPRTQWKKVPSNSLCWAFRPSAQHSLENGIQTRVTHQGLEMDVPWGRGDRPF